MLTSNLNIDVAISKTSKYAVARSGDTVEIVERPKGGVSIVLADGQGSGLSAKKTSSLVVNKAVELIAQGARDGTVARAVNDVLYVEKRGRVSSTLVIVSVDLHTKTLVISRNGNCPVFLWLQENEPQCFASNIPSIGFHDFMKPEIVELPLQQGACIAAFSDGIEKAGKRYSEKISLPELIGSINIEQDPQQITDGILDAALHRDHNRPADDMSVFALKVMAQESNILIRKMRLQFPLKVSRYGKLR